MSRRFRNAAESARGVSPRAAHRSGLDTLASSGSCHRTKTAASRRELELLLLPVGSLPTYQTPGAFERTQEVCTRMVAASCSTAVGDLPPSLHGHYPAS